MRITKYEQSLQNRAAAVIREENIKTISGQLDEAKLLASVIDRAAGFTEGREYATVQARIRELNEMLIDERAALEELTQATPDTAATVVEKI